MSHALVVDDSRTSSAMLGKMLKKHNIEAVNVDSAEQALEYLKSERPAMIFMDHMMPGMDGFDAVKAIKAETTLSSIPIIMHTSKSGDIYVGHARALGAADILSKPATDKALAGVLARLEQHADIFADLPEVLTRDSDSDEDYHPTLEQPAIIIPINETGNYRTDGHAANSASKWLPGVAAMLLLCLIVLLSMFINEKSMQYSLLNQQQDYYQLAAWSASEAASYDYGEQPLAGDRLILIEGLVTRLVAMGFQGTLRVEGHIGAFCLSDTIIDGGQALLLAPADLPLAACTQLGMSEGQAKLASVEQSEAFSRFVNTTVLLSNSGLRLNMVGMGSREPRYAYPPEGGVITAGDWNTAALQNNRLTIKIIPL